MKNKITKVNCNKKINTVIDIGIFPTKLLFIMNADKTVDIIDSIKEFYLSEGNNLDSFDEIDRITESIVNNIDKDGFIFESECGYLILVINKADRALNELIDVITHELLHAVIMIEDAYKFNIDIDNMETACYLQGYLINKIIKELIS